VQTKGDAIAPNLKDKVDESKLIKPLGADTGQES